MLGMTSSTSAQHDACFMMPGEWIIQETELTKIQVLSVPVFWENTKNFSVILTKADIYNAEGCGFT